MSASQVKRYGLLDGENADCHLDDGNIYVEDRNQKTVTWLSTFLPNVAVFEKTKDRPRRVVALPMLSATARSALDRSTWSQSRAIHRIADKLSFPLSVRHGLVVYDSPQLGHFLNQYLVSYEIPRACVGQNFLALHPFALEARSPLAQRLGNFAAFSRERLRQTGG